MQKLDNDDKWAEAAGVRREQIESGIDISFSEIFLPLFINHIVGASCRRLLDVGAGTGHLARAISKHVGDVVAIEPSFGMYSVAKSVLSDTAVELINVSSLQYQPSEKFDIVLSHMCAHTIGDLGQFIRSLSQLVSCDGELILTIPHPCFYEKFKNYFDSDFNYMEELFAKVSLNISLDPERLMPNVPFYHRPLSRYFESFQEAGMTVVKMEEPWPEKAVRMQYPEPWVYPKYCFFYAKKIR